jgi:ribosomal protein S27E
VVASRAGICCNLSNSMEVVITRRTSHVVGLLGECYFVTVSYEIRCRACRSVHARGSYTVSNSIHSFGNGSSPNYVRCTICGFTLHGPSRRAVYPQ